MRKEFGRIRENSIEFPENMRNRENPGEYKNNSMESEIIRNKLKECEKIQETHISEKQHDGEFENDSRKSIKIRKNTRESGKILKNTRAFEKT